MYNITTFTWECILIATQFSSAKPQLLLHQPNKMTNNFSRKLNWNLQSFEYSVLPANDLGHEYLSRGDILIRNNRLVYSILDLKYNSFLTLAKRV